MLYLFSLCGTLVAWLKNEILQRRCADPFDNSSTVRDLHGGGALYLVKLSVEFGVSLPRLCFHLGDETRNRECELKSAVEKG